MTEQRRPTPSRITVALDLAGLFGRDADRTLGVIEPTVDLWEAGTLVPTDEQLADLAERAGVTVDWLYGAPIEPVTYRMCFRRKVDGARCHVVTYPELPQPDPGRLF